MTSWANLPVVFAHCFPYLPHVRFASSERLHWCAWRLWASVSLLGWGCMARILHLPCACFSGQLPSCLTRCNVEAQISAGTVVFRVALTLALMCIGGRSGGERLRAKSAGIRNYWTAKRFASSITFFSLGACTVRIFSVSIWSRIWRLLFVGATILFFWKWLLELCICYKLPFLLTPIK